MLIDSVLQAVGNTPLLQLQKLSSGNVFAKAEFLNPGGSIKDRVAKHIIESAEKKGSLKPGMIDGSMTGHQVEANFNPAPVGFPAESIEVPVGSVTLCNPIKITYIITSVLERRIETRINPHRIYTQPL